MFSATGTNAATDPIEPISASGNRSRGWKQVELFEGIIGISGGFLAKPLAAQSLMVSASGQSHRFVELKKTAEWFLKAVGGPKTQKGDLKAVTVIEDIRDKLTDCTMGVDVDFDEDLAVADPSAVADEADPMDALEYILDTPKKNSNARKATPQNKCEVTEVNMPLRPSCAAAGTVEVKAIPVYSKRKKNTHCKNMPIYIRSDCLDWLLSYAADQLSFQGVPRDKTEDEADVRVANCTAVADVCLQWNFNTKAWDAEFVSGAFKGVTRSFGPMDLTTERLAQMRSAGIGPVDRGIELSANLWQKAAARELITQWCLAISNNNSGSFEKEWGLKAMVGETSTPTKKQRC